MNLLTRPKNFINWTSLIITDFSAQTLSITVATYTYLRYKNGLKFGKKLVIVIQPTSSFWQKFEMKIRIVLLFIVSFYYVHIRRCSAIPVRPPSEIADEQMFTQILHFNGCIVGIPNNSCLLTCKKRGYDTGVCFMSSCTCRPL